MSDQTPHAGPIDASCSPEDSARGRLIAATGAVSVPWVVFALTFVVAPAYVMPMFNHPITLLVMSVTLALALVVSAVCWRVLRSSSSATTWACIGVFVIAPQTFGALIVGVLGPAVITIIQALGPIFEGL